ncbi:MAG: alpha/beta hydrolase [Gemmatimonadaceae bacterium]|nr:alpha/beta hydrolase [Gemmatimonadaceae bacterium]
MHWSFRGAARSVGAATLLLAVATVAAEAQAVPSVWTRDTLVGRLADLRRIHTPDGVERLEQIQVRGVSHWVSIRGKHRDNPVVLVLHGGPGTPMLPTAWAWQTPLEDFFTIVHFDQRGVGKNAVTADREALTPSLSTDTLVADAEAVLAWTRGTLGVSRVLVLGYSYGTVLGLHLAARRPEWIAGYVGVGQVSGSGEAYLYQRLRTLATERGETRALHELDSIAPYPRPGQPTSSVLLVRKWARLFNGGWYGKPNFDLFFSLPDWAPEYTAADVAAQVAATQWTTRTLVGRPAPPLPTRLQVPVVIIQGRHDLHTPYEPAKAFFDQLQAPRKHFVTLDDAAHVPMLEAPGRFLLALVEHVRPLVAPR